MTRDEYVETIKQAALATGTNLVMAAIIGAQPIMGTPILKAIAQWVVSKILNIAILKTELGAFFLYIDFRTSAQGRAFFDAAIKNKLAQKSGSEQEKRDAEKAVIDSFRALVKFSN
jgi:hypothetical protein